LRNLQAAAHALRVRLHILHATTDRDFDAVFESLLQLRPGGLVVTSDTFFGTHGEQLAALTVRHAIPAIHQSRDFAIAGGLMSYAGSFMESHRQAGIQTGRILKGDKPADLPVQQVTKVELIINLKAAKTPSGSPEPKSSIPSASIMALTATAEPLSRWQKRQWQALMVMGARPRRYRIIPQVQPPSRGISPMVPSG
jgi:putative ABC transport system substrate-binding protein